LSALMARRCLIIVAVTAIMPRAILILVPAITITISVISVAVISAVAPLAIRLVIAIFPAQAFLAFVFFMKFVPPVPCLPTVVAVILYGFMQLPVGVGNPAITVIPVIGFCPGRASKKRQRYQHHSWR
jgi:hypothetical protein